MNIPGFKILIPFLCSLIVLCTGCLTKPIVPVVLTTGTPDRSLSWLKVYFTDPNPPDNLSNGIDRFVIQVLNAAQHSIDVASFDFNLSSVTTALVNASQRGVKVRVVLDLVNGTHEVKASESTDGQTFDSLQILKAAHIRVVDGGRSNGLMHDKIIIIDGVTLFMGSWNISYNDTFLNNNNLLDITDPSLIANYQAKFDELFVDKHFGTIAQVGALRPRLNIDNTQVENYFSPVDTEIYSLHSLYLYRHQPGRSDDRSIQSWFKGRRCH
jgi:phosphatidylserine/phosphatidylglycerophosphate/cardiolipin synthase-like enzyme